MEMELKLCPFCGQQAGLYSNYSNRARKYFVWVECDICGGRSKAATSNNAPEDEEWENVACRKVVSAWNARCADAE